MHLLILLPLLALFGGGIGFFLRQQELSLAFDSDGLHIPGTPVTLILIVFSVVLAMVILLLCLAARKKTFPVGEAFFARGSRRHLALCTADGLLFVAAGVVGLIRELSLSSPNSLQIILYVLCFFCAGAVILSGIRNFRGNAKPYSFTALIPPAFCCIWLIAICQGCISDPVVLHYIYRVFAVIFALLGFYYAASFAHAKTKPTAFLTVALLGIYFGLITVADGHDVSTLLLLLAVMLYLLVHATLLLRRCFPRPKKHLQKNQNSGGNPHE